MIDLNELIGQQGLTSPRRERARLTATPQVQLPPFLMQPPVSIGTGQAAAPQTTAEPPQPVQAASAPSPATAPAATAAPAAQPAIGLDLGQPAQAANQFSLLPLGPRMGRTIEQVGLLPGLLGTEQPQAPEPPAEQPAPIYGPGRRIGLEDEGFGLQRTPPQRGPAAPTTPAPSAPPLPEGQWTFPVEGVDYQRSAPEIVGIGYDFGEHSPDYRSGVHPGVDFQGARGSLVRAVANGRIVKVDEYRGDRQGQPLGNQVVIELDDGTQIIYAHLESIMPIGVGQTAPAGTVLGTMGNTGNAQPVGPGGDGTHLHLEARDREGNPVDPRPFLRGGGGGGGLPEFLRTPPSWAGGQGGPHDESWALTLKAGTTKSAASELRKAPLVGRP